MAMDWAWTGRLVAGALVPGPHLKTTAVSMARYSPGSVAGTSAALLAESSVKAMCCSVFTTKFSSATRTWMTTSQLPEESHWDTVCNAVPPCSAIANLEHRGFSN